MLFLRLTIPVWSNCWGKTIAAALRVALSFADLPPFVDIEVQNYSEVQGRNHSQNRTAMNNFIEERLKWKSVIKIDHDLIEKFIQFR